MKTEKQIKKRVTECKKLIKTFEASLEGAKPKEIKQLNQIIYDHNYEISVLKLQSVIDKQDLPF